MCCLFGLIDYGRMFSAKEKNRILKVLATECEARGTDATGIAFNTQSGIHIYKRPVAAHKLWFRVPEEARIIMGHTRMTTQGSEKLNYNNHPFPGRVDRMNFALAHNGVLHNDSLLQESENLPKTYIQTDSYVAVQLIEKENNISFESIRNMAEKTKGSFCYTILDDKDNLYFVKGDNPLVIFEFCGFFLYASTEEILTKAVRKLGLKNYSKVNITSGDILKINLYGNIEVEQFNYPDWFDSYYSYFGYPLYDDSGTDLLMEYASYFGVDEEDVMLLLEYGYDELEIEEMLYDPVYFEKCMLEIRLLEMC